MSDESRQEAVQKILDELIARSHQIREEDGKEVITLEELFQWLASLADANKETGS